MTNMTDVSGDNIFTYLCPMCVSYRYLCVEFCLVFDRLHTYLTDFHEPNVKKFFFVQRRATGIGKTRGLQSGQHLNFFFIPLKF